MRIVKSAFYCGANIWARSSGLLLAIEHTPADRAFLQWKPLPNEASAVMTSLRGAFFVEQSATEDWTPQSICDARVPAIDLLLLAADVLLRDFCVRPARGWLVDAESQRLRLFLPCEEADIGLPAWMLSVDACLLQVGPPPDDKADRIKQLRDQYWRFRGTARKYGLNQTTIGLARAAARRDIPHYRIAPAQFLQLGQGCHRQRLNETVTDQTGGLALWLARDKFATSSYLSAQSLPTSQPRIAVSPTQAVQAFHSLKQPVVVKPRAAGKGNGVSVNLSSDQEVARAFVQAASFNTGVVVERFVHGHDHRLLVVGGRLVAVARRLPAQVIGDGTLTVRELVHQLNQDPRRGMPFERVLEWVKLDEEAESVVATAGLTFDAIPAPGQVVPLRRTANISRGGTAVDVTDEVHPDNRVMAERVARLIGLDVVGIDFLTLDIGTSWRDIACAILEVNSSPGLRPHMAANAQRDVLGPIVENLFPNGSASRVPTAAVTGSVGKTTTCRMVAAILAHEGRTVALSTTQGAYVGADPIRSGDFAGGASAGGLLLDPRVEAGVFELARGGLLKKGMVIDACDVGAVLNVHDNHLGLDGVRNRDDLARVKRLVVENARKMAVLNADEPLCLAMRAHVSAPVCLVTENPENPAVVAHLSAGGVAAIAEGELPASMLKLYEGQRLIGALAAADIPATWGGVYRPSVVNALYAAAIAHAMGIGFATIAAALGKFQSTPQSNPGRMNFHDHLPYRLLVTWVDGKEPIAELARFVDRLEVRGKKHLMLSAVGNRPDDFLLDSGRAAAGVFSRYVCADWEDLRGRPACAAAQLLADGLIGKGVPKTHVFVAATHDDGLMAAFDSAEPGDLLVIATYMSDKAWNMIQERLGA